jgi:hypothetical protein
MKSSTKINTMDTKSSIEGIQEINETKTWFLEKINTINKPFVKNNHKKEGGEPINKIRDEKRNITTNTSEIQRIIRVYLRT